jgi:branched-chain amino acid transport system substrate-binding protein
MWVDDVNAAGGIYVKDYDKKLPVEMKVYDDKSDVGTVARNIEKLCVQDKVDFLFGPCGTALLFAAAPIANKYSKLMVCGEGGCTTLEPMLPDMPYLFSVLNFSDHFQIPVFADLLQQLGAKTSYIVFLADLHGAEYNLTAQSEFTKKNISILAAKSVPTDIKDMDPIIKEAKTLNPDVFCLFTYLDQSALALKTAIALDFNPKAVIVGPGGCFGLFKVLFGPAAEGVMCEGAWSRKSSASANAFADKCLARYAEAGKAAFGAEDAFIDWWGGIVYYSALQHFQQSIEKAGTLDNKKVRDVMATSKFDTFLGPMWWQIYGNGGGLLPQECYLGQIGQWQSGNFEVIDPGERRTAEPIYPKPAWPAAK